MKESKILKLISYFALIALTSILILSNFIISSKDKPYFNKERYFQSETFVGNYMSYLYDSIYELIHDNGLLYRIRDG